MGEMSGGKEDPDLYGRQGKGWNLPPNARGKGKKGNIDAVTSTVVLSALLGGNGKRCRLRRAGVDVERGVQNSKKGREKRGENNSHRKKGRGWHLRGINRERIRDRGEKKKKRGR